MCDSLVNLSTEENKEKVSDVVTMDPHPLDLSTMDDFDIFGSANPESSNTSKQDDQDLFTFDPVGIDILSSPESPSTGGQTDAHTAGLESNEPLSPLEIPRDGIVTDNSCANLLDFDLLGSVSAEVTEVSESAQRELGAAGNWGNNFDDSLGSLLGDGIALGSASGTRVSLDPFAGDYIDVLMEGGGVSSPSPLMTPEVGSSNPLTPDEWPSSSPDQNEEQNFSPVPATGFTESTDLMMVTEAQGQRRHDPSGFDDSECLPEIKEAKASVTASDEGNPIAANLVNTSAHIPSDDVAETAFDQSPQKQSPDGPSKLETVHKMKYKRLEYADSVDSWGTVDSYPFTPPNSIADGFQPVTEPFHLKEEALAEKIERSLPSMNIEEVDEDNISEEGGITTGSCSEIVQFFPDTAVDSELSQQTNQSAHPELLTDVQTGAEGKHNEADVEKPKRDSKKQRNYNDRAFQLALAMDLEETAIDDDEDDNNDNTERLVRGQPFAQDSTSMPPQEANAIYQAIGHQISEARDAAIIINDGKGSAIDFTSEGNDFFASVEPRGQNVKHVKESNERDMMWSDGMSNTETTLPENSLNLGVLNRFSHDLSPSAEHGVGGDNGFQEQLQSTASPAETDNVGAHQIAQNMESSAATFGLNMGDGPVVLSRQNYQDLLSEEELPFERINGATVTFVNVNNVAMETSNSNVGEENAPNGDIAIEEQEELREFVDKFINEEVIPAALETCRAEQEVEQLVGNGENASNVPFFSDRFAHENEQFLERVEENIVIDVADSPKEELACNFVRLQISGEEIVEGIDVDNKRDKATSDNVVITEVDLQSQAIFDIPTELAPTQIVDDIKATEEKSPSPQVLQSDFTPRADDANSAEICSNVVGTSYEETFNSDNNTDKQGVGGDVDVVECGEGSLTDDQQAKEIIFTKTKLEAETKPTVCSIKVEQGLGGDKENCEEDFDCTSRSESCEGGKNENCELPSSAEMTGNPGAFRIAQDVMSGNEHINQSKQPSIVIDTDNNEDNDDSLNVPKSASSSSWEKESESTDLTSSASHFTMTSNEGEFIFGDDSESMESPGETQPSESEGLSPAPGVLHGYDNKSYESSTTMSSDEGDDENSVHGAAVEGGKLVYTAGSDVEAAKRFAQDVIRNSVERYEASKIVKAVTDASLEIVKSDHVNVNTDSSQNVDHISTVITDNKKPNASLAGAQDNNESYPLKKDYLEEEDPAGIAYTKLDSTAPLEARAAGDHRSKRRKSNVQPPEGVSVASGKDVRKGKMTKGKKLKYPLRKPVFFLLN